MLITVFGRRGSGKTTMLRAMIPKQKKPVIIPDILGNFEDDDENTFDRVVVYSHVEALTQLKYYFRNPEDHPGVIVVIDSDMNRCVDFLSSALWQIEGGTLVCDEADTISMPEAPCFEELVRYGRNHGIDLITGCRRPAEISKNVTAGADIAYVLNTQEPNDIKYYMDFLGEDAALKLTTLPKHHGVWRDFQNQKEGLFRTKVDGSIVLIKSAQKVGRAPDSALDADGLDDDTDTLPESPAEPDSIAEPTEENASENE